MLKVCTLFFLFLHSTIGLAGWIPADPIGGPVPTPYPGPSPLQWELNQVRKEHSLYEVVETSQLDCAAYKHAKDLYQHKLCSHTGSNGSTFRQRAADCNTDATAEVIACGYHDAQSVLDAWQQDKDSQSILLNEYTVAIGTANVGDVWVLILK